MTRAGAAPRTPTRPSRAARPAKARGGRDLRVRHAERAADDGYRNGLVPGLKSSEDARRLADELVFSAERLSSLAASPPGLYAEVASEPDREEALWLAFLIAYLSPVEGDDPWVGIRLARTSWRAGDLPDLADVPVGPRTAHDPARGTQTLEAYRAWVERGGSQEAAFTGQPDWPPERRFARVFERLSLPGFHRAARFDLLTMLGRLGMVALSADSLHLGANDATEIAAKRVFAIGDRAVLERRAAELAETADVPLEALELALFNWGRAEPERATLGASPRAAQTPGAPRAHLALGVDAPA